MKRDEFDNALGEKMKGYRCEPPEGMFAKIESSLSATGKSATAVPAKRRLSRGWRYASAAAVLLALGLTTLKLTVYDTARLPQEEMAVSEKIAEAVSQPQSGATADNIGDMIALGSTKPQTTTAKSELNNGKQMTIAERIREVMMRESSSTQPTVASSASFSDNTIAEDSFGQIDLNTFSNNNSRIKSAGNNFSAEVRNQNDEVGMSTADYWRTLIAEDNLKNRRIGRPTMSASLYAGNFGFGSGDTNLKGVKSLVDNGMYANEVMSTPANSFIVNSVQKLPGQPIESATLRHRMPISAGVRFGYKLNDRLTIETGINYSFLQSTRDQSEIYGNYHKNQKLHYLGIPLGITYNIYNSRLFKVYLSGGGMIEKGIYGEVTEKIDGNKTSEKIDIKGIQPSVDASVGAMFMVSPTIGIYAEPGVAYYFESANQPSSYRTENPTNVTVKFGFKFLFGK